MAARSKSLLFGRPVVSGDAEKDKLNQQRVELLRHWAVHPWNWLTGKDLDGRPIIWTKDEQNEEQPLRPFPAHLEYLRQMVEVMYNPQQRVYDVNGAPIDITRWLLIDKARQMYVSTVTLLLMDWWCRFRPSRRFLVSKSKEEEATELINDKVRSVHGRLPAWIQRAVPQDPRPAVKINYPANQFGGGESYILGVAMNADEGAMRGGTATEVLVDEAAFQENTDELIASARAMAKRIWVCSSPYLGTAGGTTMRGILDYNAEHGHPEPTVFTLSKGIAGMGLRISQNEAGWTILTVDYDADPSHNEAWLLEAQKGISARKFRREIMRDWSSAAGQPFYPEWADTGGRLTHVKAAPGLMAGQPVYRGWDFGVRNPACVWLQYDPTRRRVWYLRELNLQGIGTHAFADLVAYFSGQLGEDQLTPYVKQWVRNLQTDPRYAEPFFRPRPGQPIEFSDFSGHEATQPRAEVADETAEKTSADILASKGIYLNIQYGAVRSGHELMRTLLKPQPDGWPGGLFDPHCRLLIEGMNGGLTYKRPTLDNPFSEEIKKDGKFSHIHEAALYPLPSIVSLDEPGARRVSPTLSVNVQSGNYAPADESYASVRP